MLENFNHFQKIIKKLVYSYLVIWLSSFQSYLFIFLTHKNVIKVLQTNKQNYELYSCIDFNVVFVFNILVISHD